MSGREDMERKKEDIKVKGGDGTKDNPYLLAK